eukprot:TRINITY_DN74675_c0_g1_i1.p3 TRINITY_DN74675_c0_g1~~TRINITY_DN74675_c0_g1_i1.p3  ORF type:complete len:208 (+),score=12.74 TRINITY_DN74675_c0_g1_i1:1498-2121(+)
MCKRGPQGGCSAKVRWKSKLEEVGQFLAFGKGIHLPCDADDVHKETCILPYKCAADTALTESKHIFDALQYLKKPSGFAVPPWSCPKKVWLKLLERRDSSFALLFGRFLHIVQFVGEVPVIWLLSLGIPIPKATPGKTRLIHLLDPVSKSWYAAVWNKQEHKFAPYALGTVKHRRREEPIMIARIMQFRLLKFRLSVLVLFFDVSNA